MKSPLKRFGRLLTAAFSVVAIWSLGSLWIGTQPQAFAVPAGGDPIIPISGSGGSYLLSYFDVATAFEPSNGGYGGPGHSGGTGDALLRIVDAGNWIDGLVGTGDLCANIYVFNDQQEMQECCSCPLTANSLTTFSVIADLTKDPANPSESLSAGVIKILGSSPTTCTNTPGSVTAGTLTAANLAGGLHAWINHTETMASNQAGFKPTPFGFITSTSVEEFAPSDLDSGELAYLRSGCAEINSLTLLSEHPGICNCGPTSEIPTPTSTPTRTPTRTAPAARAAAGRPSATATATTPTATATAATPTATATGATAPPPATATGATATP